jgi:transcriptional regulator with XRE-family HTH domain
MKLAAALRVSRVTVTRWETGVREIPSFLGLALAGLEAMDAEKKSGERKLKRARRPLEIVRAQQDSNLQPTDS